MVKNRIRVLISAYACEPNKGSEPGVWVGIGHYRWQKWTRFML